MRRCFEVQKTVKTRPTNGSRFSQSPYAASAGGHLGGEMTLKSGGACQPRRAGCSTNLGPTWLIAPSLPEDLQRDLHQPGVLVVDDEPAIRTLLQAILSPLGYTVHAAASGAEALTVLEDTCTDVDLVLLDCQLPGEDGISILRAVRELRPELPVILQTGHPTRDIEARLGDLKVHGVIEKPFRVDSLCSALESAQASSVFGRPPT